MRKLDLKKYDVGWEYLDYDFKSLIGVCIIMPGFTFMIVDTFISIFCLSLFWLRYLLIIHCMDGHTRFLITNRQKHLAWMTL